MQAENDDDLYGGQRSSEVKWGKLCDMATIFGQKKRFCFCFCFLMYTTPKRAITVHWVGICDSSKLRMMMTLMEVKGHQRSNGVNYVIWLPYLVKRITDAS